MSKDKDKTQETPSSVAGEDHASNSPTSSDESGDNARPRELGGRKGPEPTRYGDWEKNGRCIDF